MTSMRRRYVASTSLRRHVPARNLHPPWPPNILNLAHHILNLPRPMFQRVPWSSRLRESTVYSFAKLVTKLYCNVHVPGFSVDQFADVFVNNILTSLPTPFVVVALLFYVHGKHLRSCRDGQLT